MCESFQNCMFGCMTNYGEKLQLEELKQLKLALNSAAQPSLQLQLLTVVTVFAFGNPGRA